MKLTIQSSLFSNTEVTQLTDGQGHYVFGNVPIGNFLVVAEARRSVRLPMEQYHPPMRA